jgi:hypothetical protein
VSADDGPRQERQNADPRHRPPLPLRHPSIQGTRACRVSCRVVSLVVSLVVSCRVVLRVCRVADGQEQDENKKRAEEPNEGGAVPAPTSKRADERVVETTSATGSGSTAALGSGPVPAPRSSEEPRPAPVQPISGPPSLGGVEPHKKAPSPPSTPRSAPPSAVRPLFLIINNYLSFYS